MAHFSDSLDSAQIRQSLLAWYDRHARKMPWRVGPKQRAAGHRPDPYHVWLSEVMLQQTQVATVMGYFNDFVSRWPDLKRLSTASAEEVMAAWAGLGYYSRARNLKKCAEAVMRNHNGAFPSTAAELAKLPGIGSYTASAIAAIAFDEPVAVVDGNVERVMARLCALDKPPARAKELLRNQVRAIAECKRPGDLAQAMMDLGATICTPKKPACVLCPISRQCRARQQGRQEDLPVREAKRDKPKRKGAAFVARRADGAILLRRRPELGMLGGMSEVPTTAWNARRDGETAVCAAPFSASWRDKGKIRHSFTHFDLELVVWLADVESGTELREGWWAAAGNLHREALPTVIKKVIAAAIPGAFAEGKPKPESAA